jgi:hypothetical protein
MSRIEPTFDSTPPETGSARPAALGDTFCSYLAKQFIPADNYRKWFPVFIDHSTFDTVGFGEESIGLDKLATLDLKRKVFMFRDPVASD